MIIGAGFAGLIAAHVFPRMPIMEAGKEPRQMHNALLRFRSDSVARLTGVEFRKVRVRKGIWMAGEFHAPSIQLANMYSQKCLGVTVGERSIWNLEPVDRWIAPEDFYSRLIDSLSDRITWGAVAEFSGRDSRRNSPMISTAPLPAVVPICGISYCGEFKRAAIKVLRWRLPGFDVHQTIYFPSRAHGMYRASITGNLLIAEFVGEAAGHVGKDDWRPELMTAFALHGQQLDFIDEVDQKFGKIAAIDEAARKSMIHTLTIDHNIYSLGRFATWRNILLDDVVDDAATIKRLINASPYERSLHRA